MSTESNNPAPSSTSEHPVTALELKHVVRVHDLRVLVGVFASVVAAAVGAWVMLQNEARAQATVVTTNATTDIVRRLDAGERVQREHIEDSRQVHADLQRDLREVQRDIRDLYKTITTGAPSPRLEQPVTPSDGGR